MAYNLENLFDTERDLRTSDYTHLPLALKRKDPAIIAGCNAIKNDFYRKACLELDWNESTLKKKMNNLARVILSVDEGRGPDILFVEEVENEAILKRFNAEYLKAAGYITVFAPEGFDDRGIDVGLLSRFPIQGKPTLHKIPFKLNSEEETRRASDTRGILEVPLQLPDGSVGYFFTVHLPSQSNPHEQRRQAVEFIVGLLKDRSAKGLAVVAGDFNITADEDDRTGLYSKTLSSVGKVSHLVGCQHCRGTHYYKGSWSFLDAIVVAESGGWQMLPDTVWVVRALKEQLYHDIKPNRFDETTGEGMSDHLPIYARIGKKTN
ncbi:MAG: endonuclease/exonuclease/phosphatase family protein [Bdellovibrionaceae bacterium]|nr:endonuclease/exonuclease/phosphatase family protein [Pseudobdellovibrionaceae bacterium]